MRQVVFSKFFIISAHRCDLSVNDNHQRTREVFDRLSHLKVNFSCITHHQDGHLKPSFLIMDEKGVELIVRDLCEQLNNETYIKRNIDGTTYICNNGEETSIGEIAEVERETINEEDFIIVPTANNSRMYFGFKK